MAESEQKISALVVVHDEEAILAECLKRLDFADEIVVVLDKCTDGSKAIAERFGATLVEGSWEIEGPRRNAGIDACAGPWIFEIDADEWVGPELAAEIRAVVEKGEADIFDIPVLNHVGGRPVRHGWGGNFGKNAYPGLFRKGVKTWGDQRIHPHLTVTGRQGPALRHELTHFIDENMSDMIRRFDRYTSARARDLRDSGELGASFPNLVRKVFSRFWKSYVARKGYREGGIGFVSAMCAALYPLVSHLKATLEDAEGRTLP